MGLLRSILKAISCFCKVRGFKNIIVVKAFDIVVKAFDIVVVIVGGITTIDYSFIVSFKIGGFQTNSIITGFFVHRHLLFQLTLVMLD